ncbi:uncharacterized protein [Pyrus communis]|uniref:uncharacterized protein n=1 Tax=Pyrus communis TaxID=23211 RepID=UPI0035C1136D
MEEFWTANPVAHSRVSQGTAALSTWIFPSISVLKINCDASWTKQLGSTGFGVVIKDTSGSVMARNCGIETSSPALQAEAKAGVMAIQTTIHNNITNVIFESNFTTLVASINEDRRKANWSIFPLLHQIWNLRHHFSSFKWCWVPRQMNSATVCVALQCKREICSKVWVTKPPYGLVYILSIDGLPCPTNALFGF